MLHVWLLDVIPGLAALLVQQGSEILSTECHNVGRVLLDDRLRVVLQDVGQLLRDNNLFSAVYSLFAHVCHYYLNYTTYLLFIPIFILTASNHIHSIYIHSNYIVFINYQCLFMGAAGL